MNSVSINHRPRIWVKFVTTSEVVKHSKTKSEVETRKALYCTKILHAVESDAPLLVIDSGWFLFGPGEHQMGRWMSGLQNVLKNWNCTSARFQANL